MPKVKWDKEEESPTVSAKTRASRRNLATARAVQQEDIRKRKMQEMKMQQERLQREIEALHREQMEEIKKQAGTIVTGMEEKMLDVAWNVATNAGKRTLKDLARDAAWKVYIEAGGIKRHEEIVKADDGAFLRHFRDVIVPLSKGDDRDAGTRPVVRVNIIGAPGGDVNVAMQIKTQESGSLDTFGETPEEPAALDYEEADPQGEG